MIETDLYVIDQDGKKVIPTQPFPSWSTNKDLIFYFRTPDDTLLEHRMTFNGIPIEHFIEEVTEYKEIYQYKIHIPSMYNEVGRLEFSYESLNLLTNDSVQLVDEYGNTFKQLRKSWSYEKCLSYIYNEINELRKIKDNICKL